MKSTDNSGGYEAIPWRMVFPGAPIPAKDNWSGASKGGASPLNLKDLSIQGVSTLPQSVNKAGKKAEELLKECRRCIRKRDTPSFLSLLDGYPALLEDHWVREELFKLEKQGRSRRRRGRPDASYNIYPLIVVALVEQLILRGEAQNPEQAFGRLEELGIRSYESAKYYFDRA